MSSVAKQNPLLLAALLAAGVAVFFLVKKFAGVAGAAVDTVSGGIAGVIVGATLPGDVEVTGEAILPTGTHLAMNSLAVDRNLEFSYLGLRYRIVRRAGANYIAVRA